MASRDIYPIGQQDFKILRENGAKRGPSRIGLSKKKANGGWAGTRIRIRRSDL